MKRLMGIIVLCIGMAWFGTASATLIGDEVFFSCSHTAGPFNNCEGQGVQSAIVGAGVEFPDYFSFQNSLSLDISDSAILITFDNGPYCGWFTCDGESFMWLLLEGLDWVGMPDGEIIGINPLSNMSGVLALFGPHSLQIRLPETQVNNDHFIYIELITEHIPAPTSMMLLATGLMALFFRRRRLHHSAE